MSNINNGNKLTHPHHRRHHRLGLPFLRPHPHRPQHNSNSLSREQTSEGIFVEHTGSYLMNLFPTPITEVR